VSIIYIVISSEQGTTPFNKAKMGLVATSDSVNLIEAKTLGFSLPPPG
jgi:hypothetical protein